jgi:hypothetical protein
MIYDISVSKYLSLKKKIKEIGWVEQPDGLTLIFIIFLIYKIVKNVYIKKNRLN